MELPERSLDEMSEEDREYFLMKQKIEEEFMAHITQTAKLKDG
jgi:hypothetical protein